ncbi:MAG: sigma-E processing peptidase SpoIIGA [Oscillibacter sp.]|nr:sigma-E processing peptidase SpoIIGA [Oscillibacter sp.]
MIIYLDMAFLLNCLTDAAALYVTGRLAGLPLEKKRILAASLLGGTYGALCALPGLGMAASFLPQLLAAAGLVRLAFGRREAFLRRLLLFFMLSCAMAGALVAGVRLMREYKGLAILATLNWRVFFLAGGACFLVLSVVFRGGARHGLAGQLCRCTLTRQGREAGLTALLDTGNTLTDGLSGAPVLTVHWEALETLWTPEEKEALSRLESAGAARCLERLGPGFRLLPYQAVGIRGGLLLCFRADGAVMDGRQLGPVTVALSPTPVSDGGGYAALWGGDDGKEVLRHAA